MYEILPYTKAKAKKLNVIVKASKKKHKKIDVYDKKGNYLVSIGDKRYFDYPTYNKYFGQEIADNRRKLYKIRHDKDRLKKYSPGWFAYKLLW